MSSIDVHESLRQLDAELDVHPAIISALIRRVRSLVARLIDRDFDDKRITGAEGIIDLEVISAFHELGGDFGDAVPYALLEARKAFERDAEKQPLDHGLNRKRMVACEVLVQRLVAHIERSNIEKDLTNAHSSHLCLTKKFRRFQSDGDVTLPTSALEAAIDQNCVPVLASIEARRVTQAIWDGTLVQKYSPHGYTYFVPYDRKDDGAFILHFHPSRLGVPKYSYITNIFLWIFFLAIFTVQTRTLKEFDLFEGILWVMAAGYLVEDASRWFKMKGLGAVEFWTVLDLLTDGLLLVSFCFRVASFIAHGKRSESYELRAFQFLACVAPLIWVQLLKVFDGFVYFGTLTVIILRMFKESAIFFTLLALVMIGFGHAFLALDAADESRVDNVVIKIVDVLTQSLLGGADFDLTSEDAFGYPYGHILYYAYCFVTAVILLNILIAFFGTAYSDVVDSADEVYAAFFCQKVVAMVRAPDQFVYLPPFNLLEAFIIAPLEWVLSHDAYAKLNHSVQSVLFALPLMCIAFYESRSARNGGSIRLPLLESDEDDPTSRMLGGTHEDPIVPEMDGSGGLQISTTKFEELASKVQR
ncbi:related to YVC1 - vacuolar cation channel [Melanopsichium pennsylvanicum]|uniref:Related to YVC1 - vacuolar cation channel n=2 Tax=Melanopsichium pennsylvanicum TaxID=63383 RepID=A0AAJ4XQL8_9BASI|nr:related to YVC1-vacuolar cation channel [Melanopsichium pennsylvanicum 4]SNX85313.1 related to YVC1 - vacuolar cation channel [Melanopsichium pennsylvanicum]